MEMHQVKYFLALCEERNFTRAAKRCGVAQPSLTRAFQQLEAELGGLLFDRNRANPRLTELGILLRPDLAQIAQSVSEVNRKAARVLAAHSITHQPMTMEAFMRTHHFVAVVAVILIGFGAKLFFFPAPAAEANIHAVPSAGMNILQMHADNPNIKSMPSQRLRDLTLVYDSD